MEDLTGDQVLCHHHIQSLLCVILEKLPDVCYSWWVLASLAMLGRLHWIDKQKMVTFILACQVNITFTSSIFI